jgi:uncharacterized protein
MASKGRNVRRKGRAASPLPGSAASERHYPTFTVGGVIFDLHFVLIIVLGVLLVTVYRYHGPQIAAKIAYRQLILFFAVPLAFGLLVLRDRPARFGLSLGRWKEGLVWLAVTYPIIVLVLWFVVRDPAMKTWYSGYLARNSLGTVVWEAGVEMLGWEFIWRGFWLFGLARVIGPGPAILVQAVPFALLHLGKPELEMWTTIFGGAGFGFVAWRCQSFVYPWLIHWFMLIAVIVLAVYT